MSASRPTINDIHELLALAELTAVHHWEISGRRLPEPGDQRDEEVVPEIGIRVAPTTIETRLRVSLATDHAELTSDISSVYTLSEEREVDAEVIREFVERVAIMAIYPFIRESIFSTARKLGVPPPVLGLIRAGGFSLGPLQASLA